MVIIFIWSIFLHICLYKTKKFFTYAQEGTKKSENCFLATFIKGRLLIFGRILQGKRKIPVNIAFTGINLFIARVV